MGGVEASALPGVGSGGKNEEDESAACAVGKGWGGDAGLGQPCPLGQLDLRDPPVMHRQVHAAEAQGLKPGLEPLQPRRCGWLLPTCGSWRVVTGGSGFHC